MKEHTSAINNTMTNIMKCTFKSINLRPSGGELTNLTRRRQHSCHISAYQYKRLPFGLKNVPAQFQQLIGKIIGGLRWQAALVYIDDLLARIYSAAWPEHLSHPQVIFKAARGAGLVFSLEKCSFEFSDVKLLGHGLSRYGLHTLLEKVTSITLLAPPENSTGYWGCSGITVHSSGTNLRKMNNY